MSKRRQAPEEPENHERWLVSYADFITLLFAFFVVMYSISSVNEGKYRVLSETLNSAFSDPRQPVATARRTTNPLQIGEVTRPLPASDEPIVPKIPPASPDLVDVQGGKAAEEENQLKNVADQIERVLAPFIQDDLIEVKREGSWIEVEMKSGLLFPSGSSNLSPEGIPMLEKMADIFKAIPNAIHVEGHTDNKPINTREYPSNWELSAARAASVVHQLARDGIGPERMAAIAYGEHHPIGSNDTDDGRYKNRRVTLILQSKSSSQRMLPKDAVADPPKAPTPVATPATRGAR
jgi:chemotaxis protein MotB